MEHASTVDIGARKRRSGGINEDSVATAVLENHHRATGRPVGVFVLGDGVGGEASGDVASFLATTVVRKRLTEELLGDATDVVDRFDIDALPEGAPTADGAGTESVLTEDRIRTAIQEGIDAAHRRVQEFAREVGQRPATTIVVGVYVDGRLHYGWVGDSRLYLVNTGHETIHQLTTDQAVTNELLDRGEIEDELYARIHEDATAITNAIGGSGHGSPTVDVEFGSAEVYRDDVIALTSDGLIDAFPNVAALREEYHRAADTEATREEIRDALVTDDEIRDIVLEADDLREAVSELVSFANDRGGKDNLSIALARDPAADTSPESLPPRDESVSAAALTDQQTVVESPDDGDGDESAGDATADGDGSRGDATKDGDGPDADATVDQGETDATADDREPDPTTGVADLPEIVSIGGDDASQAAIALSGDGTIFEVGDGVTVGRGLACDELDPDVDVVGDGDGPDIDVPVDEDAIVEPVHAALERDDDGHWRVRDTSSSGTYVEIADGEWMLLLSSEGAELHRQHGFDPGAAAERDLNETKRLEDGMAFTLEDPRKEEPITFRFYSSVETARERAVGGDGRGGERFEKFLV